MQMETLNKYINKVNDLNEKYLDRKEFHKRTEALLVEMGQDKAFWFDVFKQNLSDKGYLNREWTMYDIPFLYVYENSDFYLKVHLFVPLSTYEGGIVASAIHHHNNYLLTTFAAFGSGYETMLFEKEIVTDQNSKVSKLKIREHFTQQQRPVHLIDAWEPHVVINPTSLSATLVLWSPDKKRKTDKLRTNFFLKAIKRPLRWLIYRLGIDKKVGIASEETNQYYAQDSKFYAISEEAYFAPTRAQKGAEVDEYSVQTVFAFMQRMGFEDVSFLNGLLSNPDVPAYYHKWIKCLISKEPIPDTFAKDKINIPRQRMTVKDIMDANKANAPAPKE